MDRQTDRRTDEQGESSIPPLNFVSGGIITFQRKRSDLQNMECSVHRKTWTFVDNLSADLYIWLWNTNAKDNISYINVNHFCIKTPETAIQLIEAEWRIYVSVNLSPGRRQAIIWTNAGILLIRTLGTNFSAILSEIRAFSFKKMHLKMSAK